MYRDYLNYVRTPMDFGTIRGKIHQYKTPFEFESDVRLVFENAKKYNSSETEVCQMACMLESKFQEKWTKSVLPKIEELKVSEVEDQIAFKQSKADGVTIEAETRVDECCRLLLNKLQVHVCFAMASTNLCRHCLRRSSTCSAWLHHNAVH